jgi:hypothetical protein
MSSARIESAETGDSFFSCSACSRLPRKPVTTISSTLVVAAAVAAGLAWAAALPPHRAAMASTVSDAPLSMRLDAAIPWRDIFVFPPSRPAHQYTAGGSDAA